MINELTKLPDSVQCTEAKPRAAQRYVAPKPVKYREIKRCDHPASMVDESTKLCSCVNAQH